MGMKKIVLAILCILFGTGLKAEIFLPFRHIGIRDGLPDNYVKNVFGLPDGRLGIRTTSLLSFYDGKISSIIPCGRFLSTALYRNR